MGHGSPLDTFLNSHKNQLISSGVPEHFWENLYKKLITQTFDAGKSFQLVRLEYDEPRKQHEPVWALQATTEIESSGTDHIYLIDHAWTYRLNQARNDLRMHDNLRYRLAQVLDIKSNELSTEELIDEIVENMWRINNTYSVRSAENIEDQLPIWYVMDEIGCAVNHSDFPNVRIVPFVYLHDQITYSLLFPIEDIEANELIHRDFAEGISDLTLRSAMLLPWVPKSKFFETFSLQPEIPGEEYFLSGHVKESLPILDNLNIKNVKDKYKVFSQYSLVNKFLSDPMFELVEDKDDSDILWLTQHFKHFEELSKENSQKYVNQFPFEYVITVKDLLCATCRRYKNNTEVAPWMPITYNLSTEIGSFIACYQKLETEGRENYWIIKPYNLARGMDIHITNNLNYIVRLPVTGPKIAQRYITRPVLFYRPECQGNVKFDIRYVILLKSVKPLEVYVYKNFFLRFANKPFELNDFEDYEKHFTVMNYNENVTLKHLKCEEFLLEWEKQYGSYVWKDVEVQILKMIREIFECAIQAVPPCGIADSPQSRALYAADMMLEHGSSGEILPKILEVNFMPDCQRACDYYPDFFNDIFKLLFADKPSEVFYKL